MTPSFGELVLEVVSGLSSAALEVSFMLGLAIPDMGGGSDSDLALRRFSLLDVTLFGFSRSLSGVEHLGLEFIVGLS